MSGPTETMELPDVVSLIASGEEGGVPSGVPFGTLPLASLDTPDVRDWVDEHQRYAIFVVAGEEHGAKGDASISVRVTAEDYEYVVAVTSR